MTRVVSAHWALTSSQRMCPDGGPALQGQDKVAALTTSMDEVEQGITNFAATVRQLGHQ